MRWIHNDPNGSVPITPGNLLVEFELVVEDGLDWGQVSCRLMLKFAKADNSNYQILSISVRRRRIVFNICYFASNVR